MSTCADILERLVSELRSSERFNEQELHRRLAPDLPMPDFRRGLLWKAFEQVRQEMSIVFRPTAARDGSYERATARQVLDRGARFYRTGVKKQRRALEIVRVAPETDLDDAGRRRKEAAETRIEQSIVFAQANARRRARSEA